MTPNISQRLASARIFGIDVSHHNGKIDWNKVKKAGAQFVFIKASEGATLGDDQFATNIAQARALGIPAGAYHFFIPTTNVADQVKNFCTQVGSVQTGDLAPVLDAEVPSRWITAPAEAQRAQTAWLAMTVDQRVDKIVEWADGVEKQLGVVPMLYASPSFISEILGNSPRLNKYLLWIANYKVAAPTVPAPFGTWTFWQDSETGSIDGITGNVDHDWFNGTLSQLQALRRTALPFHARVANKMRGWFNTLFGWMFAR